MSVQKFDPPDINMLQQILKTAFPLLYMLADSKIKLQKDEILEEKSSSLDGNNNKKIQEQTQSSPTTTTQSSPTIATTQSMNNPVNSILIKIYNSLSSNVHTSRTLLNIFTPFVILGAIIVMFLILSIPSDIRFLYRFLTSILKGNFLNFLNPFNITRLARILSTIGYSPYIIKRIFKNSLYRKIIGDVILNSYVKVLVVCKKLGQYKYTGFFNFFADFMEKRLRTTAESDSVSASRKKLLEQYLNELKSLNQTSLKHST